MPNYAADLNDPANTHTWDAFRAQCDACGQMFRMSEADADVLEATGCACLCPDCSDAPEVTVIGEDDGPLNV